MGTSNFEEIYLSTDLTDELRVSSLYDSTTGVKIADLQIFNTICSIYSPSCGTSDVKLSTYYKSALSTTKIADLKINDEICSIYSPSSYQTKGNYVSCSTGALNKEFSTAKIKFVFDSGNIELIILSAAV